MARVTVTGVDSTIREAMREVERAADRELRQRTFAAFADVRAATPVDTGRARNSWESRQISPEANGFDRYEVRNRVNYIEDLNMGTSRQAGAMFIEQAFLRYFDEVQVEVYNDPAGD